MIVDASVAFKWLVEEPDSEAAISWLAQDDLKAPAILLSEVGNALSKRIRGKELAAEGAGANLLRLTNMLAVADETGSIGRALELSVALSHSFYDCIYLALAEALDEKLLTADQVFAQKCEASGWAGRVILLNSHADQIP
jgi:predicted nucleic acid-binding protein